jgi:hypothetical protein
MFVDRLDVVNLQKAFYISSLILIWVGIIQALLKNRKNKKIVNRLLLMEKTNNLVHLAHNPEHKGEIVINTFNILKIGGIKMKAYFKSLSWIQLASLLLTVLLLGLGIASVFMPELAFIAENFEIFLISIGVVSSPGILNRGKELGEAVKRVVQSKGRIKELNKLVKLAKKELDTLDVNYDYLKPYIKRIEEYGGDLTAEQSIAKDTYGKQRLAIEKKINGHITEITQLKEELK